MSSAMKSNISMRHWKYKLHALKIVFNDTGTFNYQFEHYPSSPCSTICEKQGQLINIIEILVDVTGQFLEDFSNATQMKKLARTLMHMKIQKYLWRIANTMDKTAFDTY